MRETRGSGPSFRETRFDQEALGFHRKVRQRFLEIAGREPGRVVLIPGQGGLEAVEAVVWHRISAFLLNRGFKVG